MARIVTFGELMLRLSTINSERISQATKLDACFGGGEANVAVNLAHFGNEAIFVSKIPSQEIGDAAVSALMKEGVNTSFITRGEDRLGIYYLESGSSLRASKVIYDRANSAIALAKMSDFNFKKILKGADVFHFSGITPALGDNVAKIVEKACIIAKEMGILVSCDLNYRSKLWSKEKAQSIMIPLMQYVDICIGNEEDAQNCLGFIPSADIEKGKTDAEGYKTIFKEMMKKFNFKYIATSLRESISASHNGWKAMIYDGKNFFVSKHYDIEPIVDRVGAGDSFSAGIIHGLLHYNDLQKTIEFATAVSALKHTIPGDFNHVSEKEGLSLAEGNSSGRVVR